MSIYGPPFRLSAVEHFQLQDRADQADSCLFSISVLWEIKGQILQLTVPWAARMPLRYQAFSWNFSGRSDTWRAHVGHMWFILPHLADITNEVKNAKAETIAEGH